MDYISGGVICEELPKELCSFAISSASKRCVLETSHKGGATAYQCRTSEVKVERTSDYIENDYCVRACGVDRNAVGISSDSLLEPRFLGKLCSPDCHQNCPNIVDLYFNLAAGEGVFLPDLCEAQRADPRRAMTEILSSGSEAVAPATAGASKIAAAAPSPTASPPSSF